MRAGITRRAVIAGLTASAASPVLAGGPTAVPRPAPRPTLASRNAAAARIVASAGLGGEVSVAALDLADGRVIDSLNGRRPMPPASVAKVVTALYALETLGPAYRFRTELIVTGPIRDGRLEGDVVLAGGGDPTLDSDALGALAAGLKEAGVVEVTGAFRVWDGALPRVRAIDADQPDQVGYNPAISGLNLNFNRVHFEWKRQGGSYAVTMQARAKRFSPGVEVARMAIADRAMPVYLYRQDGGIDHWSVARPALGAEGARWLPVRAPAAYAADAFATIARSYGIPLKYAGLAAQAPAGAVIATVQSDPLRDLMRGMLRYSTNLTAEVAGLTASQALGAAPGDCAASAARMSQWARARYGLQTMDFADHSGLGYGSEISAEDLVRLLASAGRSGGLRDILREVKMQDGEGNAIPRDRLDVVAKTGTLNFVSALAGYANGGARNLAFAILTADEPRRDAVPREERERPPGARTWARASRRMQKDLVRYWAASGRA